jgi:DNA-directed RNA polymerase subunit K/omega
VRFEAEHGVPAPHKPERVAMEEVRRGLVDYDVPPPKPARAEGNV